MRLIPSLTLAVASLAGSLAFAGDSEQAIRKTLQALQPDLPVEAIAESPMPGVYQVQLKGGRQLYASGDGQFLIQGYMFQVKDGQAVNLTEQAERRSVAAQINAIPASEMVVFRAKDPKAHITVFTDTDCGYCQKLHSEMAELNKQGIEVRYLAFPRQGIGSHGYDTLVNVWCAKDRQAAMNAAKSQASVAEASCDNPVAKQFSLGQMVGVQGTPSVILEDGQMIPGYQPAGQLARAAIEAARTAQANTSGS
ncbi:thioredoxin fold domain-containing protein [Pseudomonas sp. Marseille-QA0892]